MTNLDSHTVKTVLQWVEEASKDMLAYACEPDYTEFVVTLNKLLWDNGLKCAFKEDKHCVFELEFVEERLTASKKD